MSAPVLDISGLQVKFPGLVRTTHVLRGVDLRISKGEVMGLVGESGSGKSMTALACLGMVPDPGEVSGEIQVAGTNIADCTPSELAAVRGGGAAMIFQNPMRALNPFYTVGSQMIEVIRRHRAASKLDAIAVALDGLLAVQMPDREIALKKYPHQMSGGQIQRVMIAMALACQPDLLIADEPTTALDVTVQAQIILLLRQLAEETGLTILFITHDLGVVASICDHVAVMYAGAVVETGPVRDVLLRPRHPYTRKLLDSVPEVGGGRGDIETIPGQVPDLGLPLPGCAFAERCDFATQRCAETTPTHREINPRQSVACHYPLAQTVGGEVAV